MDIFGFFDVYAIALSLILYSSVLLAAWMSVAPSSKDNIRRVTAKAAHASAVWTISIIVLGINSIFPNALASLRHLEHLLCPYLPTFKFLQLHIGHLQDCISQQSQLLLSTAGQLETLQQQSSSERDAFMSRIGAKEALANKQAAQLAGLQGELDTLKTRQSKREDYVVKLLAEQEQARRKHADKVSALEVAREALSSRLQSQKPAEVKGELDDRAKRIWALEAELAAAQALAKQRAAEDARVIEAKSWRVTALGLELATVEAQQEAAWALAVEQAKEIGLPTPIFSQELLAMPEGREAGESLGGKLSTEQCDFNFAPAAAPPQLQRRKVAAPRSLKEKAGAMAPAPPKEEQWETASPAAQPQTAEPAAVPAEEIRRAHSESKAAAVEEETEETAEEKKERERARKRQKESERKARRKEELRRKS